jgi:hypothetical protein
MNLRRDSTHRAIGPLLLLCLCAGADLLQGGESRPATDPIARVTAARPLSASLSARQWERVENSVDRALTWIAGEQAADGSLPTMASGQPAVTSLATMAFLSRGHQPGTGPYGEQINRAVEYVIKCQHADGLLCLERPGPVFADNTASHSSSYNHAISALMLAEVYGQVTGQRAKDVKEAIEKALQYTRHLQHIRPKTALDAGGWRYAVRSSLPIDSDTSVTAWQLMFLRSAKNAEFSVPQEQIEEGLEFVRRCWDQSSGMFFYGLPGDRFRGSRGTTGAGIISLSMGGQHQTAMAFAAGDWLLAHPFVRFGDVSGPRERYFFSTYYCSQAAAQLGGRHWDQIFPQIVAVLLAAQLPDGSWPRDPLGGAGAFGSTLSTSLGVLSLTPPYQLLPVYHR